MAKPEPVDHDLGGSSSDGFRELPTVTADGAGIAQAFPDRIGRYHIKRVIASGGMGTVYEATQDNPRRVVAVKVMKQGIASKSALRRFEYEGQILGRLRHPGIAQIYEAGTHTDTSRDRKGAESLSVPYFAMEYIPNAKSITTFAEEKKLGTRQRMELFAKVCDAIHHGHQKGIIHRDLKPSNILVTSDPSLPPLGKGGRHDAAPLSKGGHGGVVKIIDFGVARCTDSDLAVTTLQTDVGQLIGTLQYMSPEQCEGDPHDIDTRSDVYALGVVFYQLLSGSLPYDVTRMAMHQATRAIREQHPTKLSILDRTLRGDVETIALKALEKERERRYQSAADFGHDIQRYLTGEAILARRASIVYQLRLFARRNKAVFASLAATFVVLLSGVIVSTSLYLRAEHARIEQTRERQRAENALVASKKAKDEAEAVTQFLTDMLAAADPANEGKAVTVKEILDKAAKSVGEKFAGHPLIQARLHYTMGRTYLALGLSELAEYHSAKSAAIFTQELGQGNPNSLWAADMVASAKTARGQIAQAEALMRDNLAVARRELGDADNVTETFRGNLSRRLAGPGHYAEAEKLLREGLEGQRRISGPEHPDTLGQSLNLAILLSEQGRYLEAEQHLRESLEIARRTHGDHHEVTIAAMRILASVLVDQKRFTEAEELAHKTIETMRRELGEALERTPEVALYLWSVRDTLANSLEGQGRHTEAEQVRRQQVEGLKRGLGAEHPQTLQMIRSFAGDLLARGKLTESEQVLRDALQISRRFLGEDHPNTLEFMDNLAGSIWHQGRYADAEAHYRQTLEIQRRVNGEEHPNTLRTMSSLASSLSSQGRDADAEALYRQSMEVQRRVLGEEHPDTLRTANNLANSLANQGRDAEAVVLMRKILESNLRTHGEGHPDTVSAMNAVAWFLLTCESNDGQDPEEALRIAIRTCALAEQNNDTSLFLYLDTLALAQHMTGETATAVQTQQRALALAPKQHSALKELEQRLASFQSALSTSDGPSPAPP